MLLAVSLMVLGAVSTYVAARMLRHRKRVYSWPSLSNAVILSKKMGEARLGGDNGAEYVPLVEYEYYVEGRIFFGKHYYALELMGGEKSFMQKTVQKELDKISNPLTVYYNPENPSESYLVKDHPWFMYYSLFGGILMLIAGVIYFFDIFTA